MFYYPNFCVYVGLSPVCSAIILISVCLTSHRDERKWLGARILQLG